MKSDAKMEKKITAPSQKYEKTSKITKRRKPRLLTKFDCTQDDGKFLSSSAKRKLDTAEDDMSAEDGGSKLIASKRKTRFSTEVHPLHDFIFNSIINATRDEETHYQSQLETDIECKLLRMSISNKSSRILPYDEGDFAFDDTARKPNAEKTP